MATSGGSVINSGTACRCMFEPINARLASSCSRNGISPAETPTIWLAATSMYCDLFGRDQHEVAVVPGDDVPCSPTSLPSSIGASAGAKNGLVLLVRPQPLDLVGQLALLDHLR